MTLLLWGVKLNLKGLKVGFCQQELSSSVWLPSRNICLSL